MSVFTDQITIANTPLPVDGSGVTQPVSGTVSVGNFPSTQNVAVTNTPAVTISGTVATTVGAASTSTVAQVVLTSNTNATALVANASRKKAVIFAPKSTIYIKLGTTASSTSFTYIGTSANTTFEITGWAGQIDVLSTTNQTINVTELA